MSVGYCPYLTPSCPFCFWGCPDLNLDTVTQTPQAAKSIVADIEWGPSPCIRPSSFLR